MTTPITRTYNATVVGVMHIENRLRHRASGGWDLLPRRWAWRRLPLLALCASALTSFTTEHAGAQPCAGDCDGSGAVTVDELVLGVNIALGLVAVLECSAFDSDADGRVTVDEIVGAVDRALKGCAPDPMLRVNGTCLRPGATGLVGCNAGTRVRGYRCDDRATCATSPAGRTLLGMTIVNPPGSFTLFVSASAAAGALMMFEADVDDATIYRTFDFGPAGAGGAFPGTGGGDGGPLLEVLLAPDTEAAVRLLVNAGLHTFTDQGILDVIRATRIANIGTSFSGLTPANAAARAFDVASQDPEVQEAIESGMGPTPTPTATSARTSTPTGSPTATFTSMPTGSSTLTPTSSRSATHTPTSTQTPTFTQNPVAIDFGPAGGIPGGSTSLPLQLQSELSIARMDLNVVFSASTFAPETCGGDGLTVNGDVVGEGLLQLEVIAEPPRVFAAGTFMECVFTVVGAPGTYPVTLSGTITGEDATTIPVIADGTFEIDEECMGDEDCAVGQERCDDGICVPLPGELGALVTYFGLLTASNQIIQPSGTAPDGTPIFQPATGLGFGFFLVIEASQGLDGAFPGFSVFPPAGRPDVQIQSDRNLGNGSLQVCDANGIPGINPPSSDESTMITNALRDFGCRFELKTVFQPCQGGGGFIDAESDAQVCTRGTVTIDYVFPPGDTRLTVRWEDENGVLGPPASIIVRVPGGGAG